MPPFGFLAVVSSQLDAKENKANGYPSAILGETERFHPIFLLFSHRVRDCSGTLRILPSLFDLYLLIPQRRSLSRSVAVCPLIPPYSTSALRTPGTPVTYIYLYILSLSSL